MQKKLRIAIVGGGPTGLLMFRRLTEVGNTYFSIDIFERKHQLGAGMPYSQDGALKEHITNVSGNEIPEFVSTVNGWVDLQQGMAKQFGIDPNKFNEYKVLPRLLFGKYLSDQFEDLLCLAKRKGMEVRVHYGTEVVDIADDPFASVTLVKTSTQQHRFNRVIVCSGHFWPSKLECKFAGCYDSPYPPRKIAHRTNHEVALRGSSLTAIDAIRTLARHNGEFIKASDGQLLFKLSAKSPNFKIVMHSRSGLLPAVRFHLEDSHLAKDSILCDSEIAEVRRNNQGFLPLDYVYERNFLAGIKLRHPMFYELVKALSMEKFVEMMMYQRERMPAFDLLEAELEQAGQSIANREPVHWKEMLAVLSFAMNYPAKYFSAEDMERLKKTLMPLISVIIAFAPQSSVKELLALHKAGILTIVSVGEDSAVEPLETGGINYHYRDADGSTQSHYFKTFIDCIGQPHLRLEDLPYPSLLDKQSVTHATLRFEDQTKAKERMEAGDDKVVKGTDGLYYLVVPGLAINDHFQVLDGFGLPNERIYMLAVPFIGGYNPDFSGLDFGDEASKRVVGSLFSHLTSELAPEL